MPVGEPLLTPEVDDADVLVIKTLLALGTRSCSGHRPPVVTSALAVKPSAPTPRELILLLGWNTRANIV